MTRAADACLYDALRLVGRTVSVGDIVAEVAKDKAFYETSGGGVTFSGGEPLSQPEFLSALADELGARGFRTALDTSGFAPWEVLGRIARKVDLVLYDLKLMDDAAHREHTGVSNRIILENLRRLSTLGRAIRVRIPLVPGSERRSGEHPEDRGIPEAVEEHRSGERSSVSQGGPGEGRGHRQDGEVPRVRRSVRGWRGRGSRGVGPPGNSGGKRSLG